ncbi:MAG: DUF1549 and DUF1553 domain-containing protein [Gemmataceae bacterium]
MNVRWILVVVLGVSPVCAGESAVSFRNDVMAVLSRAGCNSGACHGNLNGKGGFKLSLRGQDAAVDLTAVTRDALGRRIDRLRPADSLLLAKATMAAPHEGGQRFAVGSLEHQLLTRWIAGGACGDAADLPRPVRLEVMPTATVQYDPSDRVALRVTATFSDGSRRDVTRLACYEPANLLVRVESTGLVRRVQHGESSVLVRYLDQQAVVPLAFVPARPGYVPQDTPESNYIDRHVLAKLRTLRMQPSELCSDGEFLRRACLDVIGVLPSAAEARDFLADTSSNKRARLIDRLLARPEFADFWALKWSDLLRNEEKVLDPRGVQRFHAWIRQAIVDGTPLDRFARQLIAARGSSYAHPPANYYRALRDPYTRAESTAQVFLGVRLQCARCHNHPFDRWTQDDYHRFAAFFARVQYRIVANNRRDRLDKHEFDGEQIVYLDRTSELTHPVTGAVLVPRYLGDGASLPPRVDRLTALADWVTRPDNPFFARAQANRVWQHLVGRGLVEPNDDFRDSNPASHPSLLDALAADLVAHQYDLRHLVRTITASRTYQLSPVPTTSNADDETNFARAVVRPLQAEQLLDAIAAVTAAAAFRRIPGGRAGQPPRRRQPSPPRRWRWGAVPRDVRQAGALQLRMRTVRRHHAGAGVPAAHQAGGEHPGGGAGQPAGAAVEKGRPTTAIVDELYLAALARYPAAVERQRAVALMDGAADRRAALEDVVWGLMNAKEFLLRR